MIRGLIKYYRTLPGETFLHGREIRRVECPTSHVPAFVEEPSGGTKERGTRQVLPTNKSRNSHHSEVRKNLSIGKFGNNPGDSGIYGVAFMGWLVLAEDLYSLSRHIHNM